VADLRLPKRREVREQDRLGFRAPGLARHALAEQALDGGSRTGPGQLPRPLAFDSFEAMAQMRLGLREPSPREAIPPEQHNSGSNRSAARGA
jgi:hypothetical protein